MGFFSSLKDNFTAATSGFARDLGAFQTAAAVEATLAIVALVAGADGEIEPEEIKAGENFVRKGELFKDHDRAKLAAIMAANYAKATDGLLKGDLFDTIARVKGKPVAASVVRAGIGLARADGDFEVEEKEVLIEVCQTLGLDPKSFRELA